MLSIGWIEMMVIGAIALIVVGPKDLPRMLQQVGRMVGTVRRMGNEFRSEINKATALDEVTDIRKTITQPFKTAKEDITREFNAVKDGKTVPSGAITPRDPASESVLEEIQAVAGKTKLDNQPQLDPNRSLQDAVRSAVEERKAKAAAEKAKEAEGSEVETAKKPTRKTGTAKKPAARKAPAKKPATRTRSTNASKKAATEKATSAKQTATKTADEKPAGAKRTPAKKPATRKSAATKSTARKTPAKKPAAADVETQE